MAPGLRVAPLALLLACGASPGEDAGVTGCVTHETPSFELGTGELSFEPLVDGQDLRLTRGPQGGCHFWLALRTDGFAQRRLEVRYAMSDLDDAGREIIRTRATQSLKPRADAPGRCELTGFTAFTLEPWRFENHRVRIQVDLNDDLGRTGGASVSVRALWPMEVPGVERALLCGGALAVDGGTGDSAPRD